MHNGQTYTPAEKNRLILSNIVSDIFTNVVIRQQREQGMLKYEISSKVLLEAANRAVISKIVKSALDTVVVGQQMKIELNALENQRKHISIFVASIITGLCIPSEERQRMEITKFVSSIFARITQSLTEE